MPPQECQCSALCPGTIPVACAAPPLGAPPAAGGAAWLEDEPPAEQAPIPRSAVTVSTMAGTQPVRPLLRPAERRAATGEIDMSPIMPDKIGCPA
jgi:hypothetical protein